GPGAAEKVDRWELIGAPASLKMADHVGHKVSVTGHAVGAGAAAKTEAKKGAKSEKKEEAGEHHLQVRSLKHIAPTCPYSQSRRRAGAAGPPQPAKANAGTPFTPGRMRNRPPASGCARRCPGSRRDQAVVTYSSSRPAPPNAQLVTRLTGSAIRRRSFPRAGFQRDTQPPSHSAIHSMPSASIVMPSGQPCRAGKRTATRRLATSPAASS